MSILISKSKENLTSAKVLINKSLYNSSVHCSYYSSVQLMLHILLTKSGFTQETLDEAVNASNNGSHAFAINYLFKKMKAKSIVFDALTFQRQIGELKYKRVQADYQQVTITEDLSNTALTQAGVVNNILVSTFALEI